MDRPIEPAAGDDGAADLVDQGEHPDAVPVPLHPGDHRLQRCVVGECQRKAGHDLDPIAEVPLQTSPSHPSDWWGIPVAGGALTA